MNWGDDFYKYQENRNAEFMRLCAEPCMKMPRVIVAAGFLGLGNLWARMEAVVEELGDTSIKVRFTDYKSYDQPIGSYCTWIHPALVTDVLGVSNATINE